MNTSRTVALIDDDHDDHEIFSLALSEIHPEIKCIYYDSAKDALAKFTDESNTLPDYIFLDLNMPGMNGMQFLELLQNQAVTSRIIVYSTSILPLHQDRINELGVHASFLKPYSHKELIRFLKELLKIE